MKKMNLQLFGEVDPFDEVFDNDNDFDEVDETEVDTPIETEEEQIEESEETTEAQEQPQTIKLKYNKEEKEISLEEATILAQKGMNYDKIVEKLNSFETNKGLGYLEKLAQRSGQTVEQLVEFWEAQEQQEELNNLIQNNIPEEYAKEILENRKFRQNLEEKQRHEQEKSKQDQEFKEFFDNFPNIKPEEIPQEVWAANEKGTHLKYAMMEHNYKKLQTEAAQLKNNQKNLIKGNTGGITGKQHNESYDPFLEGWDD